jgi:pyridoxine 5-phosphate synthase
MRLAINIDHIATLRNARGGHVPDPVEAALLCERAGAAGIVSHLREDRRHIRDHDVERLREVLTTKLDLEMAATEEIVGIALRLKPDLVTLVPERRQELTTEGGLDVIRMRSSLATVIRKMHDRGIAVSLFIDPVRNQVEASREIGTDMIEIHTGEYADSRTEQERLTQLARIQDIAGFGRTLRLGVNAGHGLDYGNVGPVARIANIDEVSIGHGIIVRALSVGLEKAIREMLALVQNG